LVKGSGGPPPKRIFARPFALLQRGNALNVDGFPHPF
jgi:hypothetical protein